MVHVGVEIRLHLFVISIRDVSNQILAPSFIEPRAPIKHRLGGPQRKSGRLPTSEIGIHVPQTRYSVFVLYYWNRWLSLLILPPPRKGIGLKMGSKSSVLIRQCKTIIPFLKKKPETQKEELMLASSFKSDILTHFGSSWIAAYCGVLSTNYLRIPGYYAPRSNVC